MTAPGTFSSTQGATGQHHLVLKGANGEPVVTSENHPTPEGSKQSLEVVVRTVLNAAAEVHQGEEAWTLDGEDLVERVTDRLWDQQ